jgi:hypothetical protein
MERFDQNKERKILPCRAHVKDMEPDRRKLPYLQACSSQTRQVGLDLAIVARTLSNGCRF